MLRPLIGISGNCFDTRPDPLRSGVNDAYIRAVTDAAVHPLSSRIRMIRKLWKI